MFQLFEMIRLKKTYFPTSSGTFSSKVKTLCLLLGKKKKWEGSPLWATQKLSKVFSKNKTEYFRKKNHRMTHSALYYLRKYT